MDFIDTILGYALQYVPALVGVAIVPLLTKLKDKIQKDIPTLWYIISVFSAIGASWTIDLIPGLGGTGVTPDVNQAIAIGLTQLIHSIQKSRKKLGV